MNQEERLEKDLRVLRLIVDLMHETFASSLNTPELVCWSGVCIETDRLINMFSFSNEEFRQFLREGNFLPESTTLPEDGVIPFLEDTDLEIEALKDYLKELTSLLSKIQKNLFENWEFEKQKQFLSLTNRVADFIVSVGLDNDEIDLE